MPPVLHVGSRRNSANIQKAAASGFEPKSVNLCRKINDLYAIKGLILDRFFYIILASAASRLQLDSITHQNT